jgi:hypothetical protein
VPEWGIIYVRGQGSLVVLDETFGDLTFLKDQ